MNYFTVDAEVDIPKTEEKAYAQTNNRLSNIYRIMSGKLDSAYLKINERSEQLKNEIISKVTDSMNHLTFIKSPNLFDMSNAYTGYFYQSKANYSDEECLVEHSDYTAYRFEVEGGESYTVTGTSFIYTLYRADGVRILSNSSYENNENFTINTTPETAFVTISFKHIVFPAETYMIVEGESLPEKYMAYNKWYITDYLTLDSAVNTLPKTNTISAPFIKSQNIFDKTKAKQGYFYQSKANYSDEECLAEHSDYTAYQFEVEGGNSYTVTGTSFIYTLYRSDGVRIMSSSLYSDQSNVTIDTTPETAFVTISFKHNIFPVESYMIVADDNMPSNYIPYGWIASDNVISDILANEKITANRKINVCPDGTGDFSTIYEAVCYANERASTDCRYDIYIHDISTNYQGTSYDIFEEMYESDLLNLDNAASSAQAGLPLNGYVNLIGIGKVKLYVHLPDNASLAQSTAMSVLDIFDECYCENLTFEAKNCRYAVHDESNGQHPKTKHIFKNCTFIHLGNKNGMWPSPAPYAGGTSGACSYEFYNCIFDSTSSGWYAWTTHTRQQALGSNFIFDGCIMSGGKILPDRNLYSIKLGYNGVSPYNSNSQKYKDCAEHVFLKNTIADGSIKKTWENNNYSCTDNFIIHNFTSVPVISDGDHIV